MDYAHEGHNVHLVVYQFIWCPKRRRKVLVGPLRTRLEQIVREVAAEHEWTVIELAMQPDHVHLFIRANPRTLTCMSNSLRTDASLFREAFMIAARSFIPGCIGCR